MNYCMLIVDSHGWVCFETSFYAQLIICRLQSLLTNGTSAEMPSRVINIASMAGIQTTDVTSGEDGGLSAPGHGTFSCQCFIYLIGFGLT